KTINYIWMTIHNSPNPGCSRTSWAYYCLHTIHRLLHAIHVGKAQVSPLHANFIVNLGGATAQNVLTLIQYVQSQINQKWSLQLHPEVRLLGDFEDSLLL
ncbi:MAG: hypothetical protein F6K42_23030, partial [Leptolyngbya sp. SIO1D8]|nr:hypothetical protein [Leptolyngbya sp. SIO1D8]